MKFKPRFKYWQIIVGVIGLAVIGYTIYSIVSWMSGPIEHEPRKVYPNANPKSFLRTLHDFFYMITLLYFGINYFYELIAKNKKFIKYLEVGFALVFACYAYKTILYSFFPIVLHNRHPDLLHLYRAMIGGTLPPIIVSYVAAFITYLLESKKQRRILEAQKLVLETQISQANYNFLKAQINPHFLHNTLNFLYAKSLPYSEDLSEGILTLSDIMRYALGQSAQKDGKALLKDEIEHMYNVIKISQLRFSNQLKVDFEVKGDLEGAKIIPFVLITLVENAFKHGDLKDQDNPIVIRVNVASNRLYFYCRNKKKTGPKELSTGIGLENIKKRLELAYGDKYHFLIKDEPGYYTTELIIDEL